MSAGLQIRRLTGSLGAEVEGLALRPPLQPETVIALHRALIEHQVLFFHHQDLTDDEHLALAGQFGKVSIYPLSRLLGATGPRVSTIRDDAESPPDADGWHTDVTWIDHPPAAAFLSARLIPAVGGDTLWASLYGAYDLLSPVMQEICGGLTVRHWYGMQFETAIARFLPAETVGRLRAEYLPVEHPLVTTHPVTGRRALLLSGLFMHEIVGLHPDESATLLRFLQRKIDDPNIGVRWRWCEGDLAIWDERCTNHRALSDHYPAERMMRRCTVDGPLLGPERLVSTAQ